VRIGVLLNLGSPGVKRQAICETSNADQSAPKLNMLFLYQ